MIEDKDTTIDSKLEQKLNFLLSDDNYVQEYASFTDGGVASVCMAANKHGERIAVKMARASESPDDYNFNVETLAYEEKILGMLPFNSNFVYYLGSGTVDGKLFLAFEPLAIECPQLNGSVARAISVVSVLALTLDFLHKKGYCHRDVKPENIRGRTASGVMQPVLIDFGSCAPLDIGITPVEIRFYSETVSPHATPPEIIELIGCRKDRDINIKRDVFGLGCVLYKLLTHEDPYDFKKNEDGHDDAIYCPSSQLEIRAKNSHVSERLEQVVRLSLEVLSQRLDMESFYCELSDCLRDYEQ